MKKIVQAVLLTIVLFVSGCAFLNRAQKAATTIPRPVWDKLVEKNPELSLLTDSLYGSTTVDPYAEVNAVIDPWADTTGHVVQWPLHRVGTKTLYETMQAPPGSTVGPVNPTPVPTPRPDPIPVGRRPLDGPNTGAVVP